MPAGASRERRSGVRAWSGDAHHPAPATPAAIATPRITSARMSFIHDISGSMSYIRDMLPYPPPEPAQALGAAIRTERKRLGLTQAEAARRAGLIRQKFIQVEQGRPGVAVAAYLAAMHALGLEPALRPARIRTAAYPQLQRLLWNQPGAETIEERDALALYERYWDLVDEAAMPPHERRLLDRLVQTHGNGILHV